MLLQQGGRQGRVCCCFRFQLGSLDILASSFPPTSPSFAELEISGGDITGVLIKPGCHTLKGHRHRRNGAPPPPPPPQEKYRRVAISSPEKGESKHSIKSAFIG